MKHDKSGLEYSDVKIINNRATIIQEVGSVSITYHSYCDKVSTEWFQCPLGFLGECLLRGRLEFAVPPNIFNQKIFSTCFSGALIFLSILLRFKVYIVMKNKQKVAPWRSEINGKILPQLATIRALLLPLYYPILFFSSVIILVS